MSFDPERQQRAARRVEFERMLTAVLCLAVAALVLAVRVLIDSFDNNTSDWANALFAIVAGGLALVALVLLMQLSLSRR
jgi:formate-dependent nitrite reductase membrane component NrfD